MEGIQDAVVMAREEDGADKNICAYFVPDSEYGILELREYLSKELPDYMMPACFVVSLAYWLVNLYWIGPITPPNSAGPATSAMA